MAHFDDAQALLSQSELQLASIQAAYEASLEKKEVSPELLIAIKNLMENLRSALDFAAHGLFLKFGKAAGRDPRVYFPYAKQDQTRSDFIASGRIEACIPGLSAERPDIVARLEGYQHFAAPDNEWLPVFMELNNENKHQQLTPQTRKESKELRLSSRGGEVAIGPGASISLGPGASMRVGDMVIRGPQDFDAATAPSAVGSGKVTVVTWVGFHFVSNDEPVLPFLRKAFEGVKRIIEELAAL